MLGKMLGEMLGEKFRKYAGFNGLYIVPNIPNIKKYILRCGKVAPFRESNHFFSERGVFAKK